MTDDDAFLESFTACTLGKECFKHRDHLRAAWLFLRRHRQFEAIDLFVQALRTFTQHHGAERLFHATTTGALMVIMHERMVRNPGETFDAFLLDNQDLLVNAKGVIERHYPREFLDTDLARRVFLLPPPVRP